VRYMAWQSLHKMGQQAAGELEKLATANEPIYRARALWLLGKMDGRGSQTVKQAMADKDANIRIVGVRLARQLGMEIDDYVAPLVNDPSPQVRRELAVALRSEGSEQADQLWATLAMQHDGKDRWYLEALGIGADHHASSRFEAWLKKVGSNWDSAAGREILWRIRADEALPYIVKVLQDPATSEAQQARFMRAFDFHSGEKKDAALKSLLGL